MGNVCAGVSIEQRGDTDHAHSRPTCTPCIPPASHPAICHAAQQHACHACHASRRVGRGFSLCRRKDRRDPCDDASHSKLDSHRCCRGRLLWELSGMLPWPVYT